MEAISSMTTKQADTDLSKDVRYLPVGKANGVVRLLGAGLNALSHIAPAKAASLVNHLAWCRPPRPPLKANESGALARAEQFEVVVGGEKIRAYRWGTGPAVLLVHGWGGSAGQMSQMAVGLASQGFSAIAYDAPAHGKSRATHTDFPTMAAALKEVASAAGGVGAVVAHSAGCVALLRAIRTGFAPQRVVMVSAFAQLALPLASLGVALGLRPRLRARHVQLLRATFGADFLEAYSPEALVLDLEIPGLIVHDAKDREFGVANALRIAAQWRGSESHLTDGLGHYRVLKDEAVAQRIGESLSVLKLNH